MFAGAALLLSVGLLGWALLWPESACSDPFCARPRFSIFVEVDAFRQVNPVPFQLGENGQDASIRSIFATGGIDVDVALDQSDLPYDASVGYLNDADLYQLAGVWRSRSAPAGADARLYALIAPRLVSNTGEALFGVMFDTADREAFAVAPQETLDRFGPETAPAVPALQMRTFMHELLHALNRTHLDAAQFRDGRLTIEAPTKCLVDPKRRPWSLTAPPLLALSPDTIRFFQTAPVEDVLPGKANKPYKPRRSSADECRELRATVAPEPAFSRWALAMRRLRQLPGFVVGSADAAAQEQTATPAVDTVRFEVQALTAPYPLGYPVAVRFIATNNDSKSLPLRGRLNPSFGIVQVDVRTEGAEDWKTLRPLVWFEPADDSKAMLDPGQTAEQTVAVYFGEEGWTFPRPGRYELRARLKLGDDHEEVIAPVTRIEVAAPAAVRDAASLKLLTGEDGRLDPELGRLLMFGGRIGERSDLTPIERLVKDFPDTALGSASKLTLASRQLRRPLDPVTGMRPAADVQGARRLLRDSCTDSGVAALKDDLLRVLEPAGVDAPDTARHLAWDGFTRQGSAQFHTYSDRSLTPVGPSIHFCVNERRMRNTAWFGTHDLARAVSDLKPTRIVIVGHTDTEGGCGYNDELGLARAESVKNVLVKSGIRPGLIQTVALGKRRPVDFSATAEARMLNRRVEILVETAGTKGAQTKVLRAIPSCPESPGPE